jgi:hypothetical protein
MMYDVDFGQFSSIDSSTDSDWLLCWKETTQAVCVMPQTIEVFGQWYYHIVIAENI